MGTVIQPKVVCIGVPTLDAIALVEHVPGSDELVPASDARLAGGGVAATASVTLARLGVPVALLGRVADDQLGRWIRDELAREGVDVTGVRPSPGRSPLSLALVERGNGKRSLAPFPGALEPVELQPDDLDRCRAADWIHVGESGYRVLPTLHAAGIGTPISVDAGNPIAGLDLAGIALYAPTEQALLARYPGRDLGAALRSALDEGPRIVVATRGEAGAVAAERGPDGDVTFHDTAAVRGPVVSTLGAGDVFHGALLAAIVDGKGLENALREAHVAAALSCRALDGRSAIPTRSELDAVVAASTASAWLRQPAG